MSLIKKGKVTILKTMAGVVPSLEVAFPGMTENGTVILTLAERKSNTDVRGQMEFYAVCEDDKFTIYGEEKELYTDTILYYEADANGSIAGTVQVLEGAGAVDLISNITHLVTETAGGDALTLDDGYEGQTKIIIMKTDGGDGTLTPENLGNGNTITFDTVGDCASLIFSNGAWYMIGGTATLA